jgi:hypothetical protein
MTPSEDRFDHVGWSLGASIGITAAGIVAERLRTLTLIDHCGREERGAYAAVRQGLDRLDAVVDRPEDYVGWIRDAGMVTPWNEYWTRISAERALCVVVADSSDPATTTGDTRCRATPPSPVSWA